MEGNLIPIEINTIEPYSSVLLPQGTDVLVIGQIGKNGDYRAFGKNTSYTTTSELRAKTLPSKLITNLPEREVALAITHGTVISVPNSTSVNWS